MSDKSHKVANIIMRKDRPTEVTTDDLFGWVIWQFPRQMSGGLCGAVHPPVADHTWYPAVLGYLDNKVKIHGHLGLNFDSPKDAADWLLASPTLD